MLLRILLTILFVVIVLFILLYLIPKMVGVYEPLLKKDIKLRKLDNKESEWMADYFHNNENAPDIDGYVGHYYLPEEVMVVYREKYGKERDWSEEK